MNTTKLKLINQVITNSKCRSLPFDHLYANLISYNSDKLKVKRKKYMGKLNQYLYKIFK